MVFSPSVGLLGFPAGGTWTDALVGRRRVACSTGGQFRDGEVLGA